MRWFVVPVLGLALVTGAFAGTPPPRKIVFAMPVAPPNVVHTPVALAKELGFMDKFNIDLDIKHFEGFFESIILQPGGAVTVFRRDGTMLARHPHVERMMGEKLAPQAPFYAWRRCQPL